MARALQQLGYCEKAIALKYEIEDNFLLLAEYLWNIKEHQMYDSQWSSFEEFVEEMKMSLRSAYRLIQIHEKFVLEYQFSSQDIIAAGGTSSLSEILPQIASKKDAIHWMNLSSTLTRSDLRKELTEAKTGLPMKNCPHADTYSITICKKCGEKTQIETV